MFFELIDSLSLPGYPDKPNEDAFAAEAFGAVVFDGATPLGDPLMPGKSDAAWLAQFATRRLMAHLRASSSPRGALRHAIADAERSFAGLRRRAPAERYEMPCASMMLVVPGERGFDALWYGDCAAVVQRPDTACEIVGIALEARDSEANNAARVRVEKGVAPVEALNRADILPYFREGRAKVNTPGNTWLFAPDAVASEKASRLTLSAPAGTYVLLASDGFLALASAYGRYGLDSLMAAAQDKGLKALGKELRAVEAGDPNGETFARFKQSDDATAVLLRLA